jgi:hypothetical protein
LNRDSWLTIPRFDAHEFMGHAISHIAISQSLKGEWRGIDQAHPVSHEEIIPRLGYAEIPPAENSKPHDL